jgi:hypothetical protein
MLAMKWHSHRVVAAADTQWLSVLVLSGIAAALLV